MISLSPTAPPATAPSEAVGLPEPSVQEVERSARAPGLVLLAAAAVWLGCGVILALMSAIKAHAPGFLADAAWLTYGRVYPAGQAALVYGFIIQAGLGVGYWMLCRLGRNLLQGGPMIIGLACFWNLGLILGLAAILAGANTGYPWLEMPATAAPILLSAYVFLAAWGLVNLHGRRRRRLYVSQWFLLITLVWFPWVFSTAMVLLLFFPVRGVMQTIVSGWYAHNLFELCLTSVGLAIIFYFLPKLLNRPLHSRGLALFGYWVLVFFGGWGGLHRGEPVPNWLSGVSGVAQVFVLLAVLAFGLSWFRTLRDSLGRMQSDGVLRFIGIGMVSYILAAVLKAVAALPGVSEVTDFTLFTQGLAQLQIHGFLIMTLAGAVYYAGPRLAGCAWPTPGLMKVHFWSAAAGVVVMSVALLIGGILQGMGIAQPQTDFTTIARRMVPFLGTATLGTMLLLIGYGAFLLNLVRLLLACCPCAAVWERVRPQVAAAGLIGRAGS